MKKELDNEQLLKYIQKFHPLCMKVISFEWPYYSGLMGTDRFADHLIVNSVFVSADPSIPINNLASKKAVKLKVDKKHFDYWLSEQNSVQIID